MGRFGFGGAEARQAGGFYRTPIGEIKGVGYYRGMTEVNCRIEGCAGRITINRPGALNALTWPMCKEIRSALSFWADDMRVALVIIDAVGERAFCAGGDIVKMYHTGTAGDVSYGRAFWADQYRMDTELAKFPKPIVSFLQGFTMGGGVGMGCHVSHRVVCETSRISMPECKIGLIPDVGGSLLLARAPGRLGEFLALTARRMGPEDARYCGFADYCIPAVEWPSLQQTLAKHGDCRVLEEAASTLDPQSTLAGLRPMVDTVFASGNLAGISRALRADGSPDALEALEIMETHAPLAMACALELIARARIHDDIQSAVQNEYRFSARSMEQGDFLEGIRATLIDKDSRPRWKHSSMQAVSPDEVATMLSPLGEGELSFCS